MPELTERNWQRIDDVLDDREHDPEAGFKFLDKLLRVRGSRK